MSDPNRLRTNGSGRRANAVCRTNRSTGNFQRNRARFGQRAPDHDESSAGRNVYRRGKFQRFLAVLVPTANENRYREAEPRPLAFFFSRGVRTQSLPSKTKDKPTIVPQIGGQTSDHPKDGWNPAEPRYHYGNYGSNHCLPNLEFTSSLLESATFFASVPVSGGVSN
jgi:hypothetical protein